MTPTKKVSPQIFGRQVAGYLDTGRLVDWHLNLSSTSTYVYVYLCVRLPMCTSTYVYVYLCVRLPLCTSTYVCVYRCEPFTYVYVYVLRLPRYVVT